MSEEQRNFIIQVVKFICVQVIKQHCVFCKFVKKAIESQLVVVVSTVCNKMKLVPRFNTERKRGRNRKVITDQVNLAVDTWMNNVIDLHLDFYKELWADFFVDHAPVWYKSKVKLVEMWTSNKSNIVEKHITSVLLSSAKKKKKKKIIKKIFNHHRNRILRVTANNNNDNNNNNNRNHNNNNRNHRNLVNKNRNHNNR